MRPDIITRLNAINREFYRVTATEFDQTRLVAWAGWEALLPYLRVLPQPVRVLDVGCGNGRFGVFLGEQNVPCIYHGTDNNPALLALAHTALQAYPHITATLTERDSILQPLTDVQDNHERYDFVGVFGVLHHVPGVVHRLDFVRALAGRVAEGGTLALAMWRFYEFARFQERIVAWDDDLAPLVEKNDFLLDWRRGERALRYCHYIDDAEQNTLIHATGLNLLKSYRADGYNNAVNSYVVLQK